MGGKDADDRVGEEALAGAGSADHGHDLARLDVEREARQAGELRTPDETFVTKEGQAEVFDSQHGSVLCLAG
jgi:hypothetical protein